MQLAVDIGNTLTKYALFEGEKAIDFFRSDLEPVYLIKEVYEKHPNIEAIIISSVNKTIDADLIPIPETIHHVIFDQQTPMPLKNLYTDKHSLGQDRLANAVAAVKEFPAQNVLVIDVGTCITYDIITAAGVYLGGQISPGIRLRFEALHRGTARLPLLPSEIESIPDLIGKTTAGSMEAGVIQGIIHEINGNITAFQDEFDQLKVVLTGGNAPLFESVIKSTIFADPNFVLRGLNHILQYNIRKI